MRNFQLLSSLRSSVAIAIMLTGSISCADTPSPRTVITEGTTVTLPEQNWSDEDAEWFYNITQGSQLAPYDWFVALELHDSEKNFVEAIPAQFLYIARKKSDENVDGLPVGFVRDEGVGRDWAGLTCAACHTAVIEHDDKSFLIDGGPGMGDLEGLLKSLVKALSKTAHDDDKFDRFAKEVLGSDDTAENRARLLGQLDKMIEIRTGYNGRNLPLHPKYQFGFGRVDAFGAILNEVTVRFIGVAGNYHEANAPVSYPHLWDTPHHDFVQWNSSAPNAKGGDLGRNVGEVLGVFGNILIPEDPPLAGYRSTVQISNLRQIEKQVTELKSPLWPAAFGTLDDAAINRGQAHYVRLCTSCHTHEFDRDDPDREIVAKTLNVGTDPLMASNFRKRDAFTGKLEGSRINFIPFGGRFGANSTGEELLIHTVIGTILGGWKNAPPGELANIQSREAIVKSNAPGDAYKARPLNGSWATGPFLHNGSVPTLRDLLKPSAARPKTFWVGNRKYNTTDAGFATDKPAGDRPGFLFDPTTDGNHNTGHEYGTGVSKANGGDDEPQLTPAELDDLLEFLKSL